MVLLISFIFFLFVSCLLLPLIKGEAKPTLLFNPKDSSSLSNSLFSSFPEFENTYADGSSIAGYVCEDIIEFGTASTKVNFGCASITESLGTWDYDGILGLGLKENGKSLLSTPYFYSLCDSGAVSPCIFSLLLSDDGGEIQLAGYVEDSINTSSLVYASVSSACSSCDFPVAYTVDIDQLRLSGFQESYIIYNIPSSQSLIDLVTIVDSGVSCTLLPTAVSTSNGDSVNIFALASSFALSNPNAILYVMISGQEFALSLGDCFFQSSDPNVMTLGDPFFRNRLVIHDLSKIDSPRLGFADQWPGYKPQSGGVVQSPSALRASDFVERAKPLIARNNKVSTLTLWKQINNNNNNGEAIVDVITETGNSYFTSVSIGSPRQSPFIIQIDTGSSLTAIFSNSHPRPPAWQISVLVISIVIFISLIIFACFIFCRRMKKKRDQYEYQQVSS